MVTAGPTHEKIDPVRFIGNYSSGKMGYAIAEELAQRGANVKLISGPVSIQTIHRNIQRIDVVSAEQMYHQCVQHFLASDGAVMCAAVADFKPETEANEKVKRGVENFTLTLKPNPDIAAKMGEMKSQGQLLVGFALETNDERNNALLKIKKKNLDFIVLNSLNDAGAGFQTDTNKITIIDRYNNSLFFELKSKHDVAVDIVDQIILKMAL
ncbi:MAG TPA: phosphopantothenoylcysteine decarboxylase [Prolixibacteraceae bacterium]|nr:phosphopantothenoylcysteine decarboxylase [Prolixibacteraceae bacterium]